MIGWVFAALLIAGTVLIVWRKRQLDRWQEDLARKQSNMKRAMIELAAGIVKINKDLERMGVPHRVVCFPPVSREEIDRIIGDDGGTGGVG